MRDTKKRAETKGTEEEEAVRLTLEKERVTDETTALRLRQEQEAPVLKRTVEERQAAGQCGLDFQIEFVTDAEGKPKCACTTELVNGVPKVMSSSFEVYLKGNPEFLLDSCGYLSEQVDIASGKTVQFHWAYHASGNENEPYYDVGLVTCGLTALGYCNEEIKVQYQLVCSHDNIGECSIISPPIVSPPTRIN